MAFDKVYYFDKKSFIRYELGEIQTNFNLNIVIDGDKDSMQIEVHSYSREALQPNTIIYHANDPLQWFVIKKDNVKRNANEKGFYYIHSLTLNGAIDLTKNRDLTDCGFNANNYTIDTFFRKLLKLSNFEYDYEIDYGNNVDKDKKVDYIKSYENYTLLSAIRDFFNGYNCEVKLGFETEQIGNPIRLVRLKKAIFKIIPRTGNIDLPTLNIDELDDIRESINFDKESYGTTVISNAQNVVSTLAKTYPQIGGVSITGSDYETTMANAFIKLPSPAWKVNWVKVTQPQYLYVVCRRENNTISVITSIRRYLDLESDIAINEIIENLRNELYGEEVIQFINDNLSKIKTMCKYNGLTFYNNPKYDPRTNVPADQDYGSIVKEDNVPYIAWLYNRATNPDVVNQVALMDKDSAGYLKNKNMALVWERGSEKITGLALFESVGTNRSWKNCDLFNFGAPMITGRTAYYDEIQIFIVARYIAASEYPFIYHSFYKGEWCFQVNYIPMSDIKVKQDNENNNNDIQLYNQNGKLNDSVALSKMIDSYSKEITNPTITRYGEYHNINDIPQIGQIVMDGNTKYVINNISYNLYPCESNDEDMVNYYCECEFTLAEFISTKSIMTSPNTNVRDYIIPQKYNIKRRQVYRDYYEFGFESEQFANIDTPYAKLENYLQLSFSSVAKEFDHTALIKIDYEQEVSGKKTWYYQLNSTAYTMAKSVYEIIDFDDNNIIGYDIQNSTTGFSMSDLWSNQYRAVTTPVSYVDELGKFVGITLQMVGKKTLEQAYSQVDTQGYAVMLSAHCFINDKLYDLVAEAPYETLSETTNKSFDYTLDPYLTAYTFSFVVSATELGIAGNIEINSSTILGLESKVLVNNSEISDYELTIVSFSGRNINVRFSALNSVIGASTGTINIELKARYIDKKSIADYIINEPNYEKDPIEVPVFEYSLQLGDTKDVEVGDNILKNNVGLLSFYTAVIRPKNTVTNLNASKWFTGLSVSGDSYSDPEGNYDCQIEIANRSSVDFALEENNTKLRIKVFNNITALFYGVEANNVFTLQSVEQSGNQIAKDSIIDKDIVIYRHTIKSMTYDSSVTPDKATCDYDTELMYIIHAPQEEQFEENDLVLNVNYYKLR